jgi:hypothetical protein
VEPRKLPCALSHADRGVLCGALEDVDHRGLLGAMLDWLEDLSPSEVAALSRDPNFAAFTFLESTNKRGSEDMKNRNDKKKGLAGAAPAFELPLARREPCSNPWSYAYLIYGEKKIGKTSFAIQGGEEFVLQFDKPQLAYAIRETMIDSWAQLRLVMKALEAKVKEGEFPFQRVVVDGAGEMYQMCHDWACKEHGVAHPKDGEWGSTWALIRTEFTSMVNRLLRLQGSVGCGMIFIAHSEEKEVETRDGRKIDKMVPNLPKRAEEIINGKVDGWFVYDYHDGGRSMILLGDERTGAGHRIDHFFTTVDGRRVREIDMGDSAEEASENFVAAFNNQQAYATLKEKQRKEAAAAEGKDARPAKKRRKA